MIMSLDMPDIAYRDNKKRDSGEQNTNITETKRKISNYILKLKQALIYLHFQNQ